MPFAKNPIAAMLAKTVVVLMPNDSQGLTVPISKKSPAPTCPPPSRQDLAALWKTIGLRMKEAREMAGLLQTEAARLLGYQNSSALAKIEGGSTDTGTVPVFAIKRAAEIYDVSIDFLFGASDDWERDPGLARQRAVGAWLLSHWEMTRQRDVAALAKLQSLVSATLEKLTATAQDSGAAFVAFRARNQGQFDELLGGARLLAAHERLRIAVIQAQREIDAITQPENPAETRRKHA